MTSHGQTRPLPLLVACLLLFAVPPGSAQSMVGYGLGVSAAGSSGGGLKKTGDAVGKRYEALPIHDQAPKTAEQFVGPPSPAAPSDHELPVDFARATGVVRLYTRWSGPDDAPEDAAQAAPNALVAQSAPAAPPQRPWGSDWVGSTREELAAALGKPILSVAGGGGPDDGQLTFKLPDGAKARFLIRSGVVVSASRY